MSFPNSHPFIMPNNSPNLEFSFNPATGDHDLSNLGSDEVDQGISLIPARSVIEENALVEIAQKKLITDLKNAVQAKDQLKIKNILKDLKVDNNSDLFSRFEIVYCLAEVICKIEIVEFFEDYVQTHQIQFFVTDKNENPHGSRYDNGIGSSI